MAVLIENSSQYICHVCEDLMTILIFGIIGDSFSKFLINFRGLRERSSRCTIFSMAMDKKTSEWLKIDYFDEVNIYSSIALNWRLAKTQPKKTSESLIFVNR